MRVLYTYTLGTIIVVHSHIDLSQYVLGLYRQVADNLCKYTDTDVYTEVCQQALPLIQLVTAIIESLKNT